MATEYAANFTKYNQNDPREVVDVGVHGGRVRLMYDTYTAAALAADSTISVGKMPKGALVWDAVIMGVDALGSGHTISMGDAADVDRLIGATLFNTAGKVVGMLPRPTGTANAASTAGIVAGFGYEYTTTTDIILTTASAAITGIIRTAIWYTVD